jgi:hydrogenase maturation factor
MFIIAICGFGIPMSWQEPKRDKHGQLSTQEMISEVATGILIRSRAPAWMYKLGFEKCVSIALYPSNSQRLVLIHITHRLTAIDEAYNTFVSFMHQRIAEREAEIAKLRAANADADVTDVIRDVFGRLVAARMAEGKYVLSDDEIIGNCFVLVRVYSGSHCACSQLTISLHLADVCRTRYVLPLMLRCFDAALLSLPYRT